MRRNVGELRPGTLGEQGERTHFRSLAATAIDPESDLGWRMSLEALTRSGDAVAAAAEADRFENWLRLEQREAEPASRVAIRTAREVATNPRDNSGKSGPLIADLVGCEREFNAILDVWGGARAGEPQLVLLTGSVGLGKTRLLEELRRRFRFRRLSRRVRVRLSRRPDGSLLLSDFAHPRVEPNPRGRVFRLASCPRSWGLIRD
jgi:hypothetical protein